MEFPRNCSTYWCGCRVCACLRAPLRLPSRAATLKLAEIGKELQVDHILEGSVRKAGDRIRVTAQLIEVNTDTHLWSETYTRQLDDIFAVQDEIAQAIVSALKVTLTGNGRGFYPSPTQPPMPRPTTSTCSGRHLWNQAFTGITTGSDQTLAGSGSDGRRLRQGLGGPGGYLCADS